MFVSTVGPFEKHFNDISSKNEFEQFYWKKSYDIIHVWCGTIGPPFRSLNDPNKRWTMYRYSHKETSDNALDFTFFIEDDILIVKNTLLTISIVFGEIDQNE